ncbi:pickpocket protein 28-like [Folsomia candida]|uniref:pickpocket protein 28-like n=1 Tax=Folsomia candida TaxID=158441 RepID=UPI0016050144|nr:pickpocket protein 28-like [Folsomia candida]
MRLITTAPLSMHHCPHLHDHNHLHANHLHHKAERRRSNSLPSWAPRPLAPHPLPLARTTMVATAKPSSARTHIVRASERRVSFVEVELSDDLSGNYHHHQIHGRTTSFTRRSRSRDPSRGRRSSTASTGSTRPLPGSCYHREFVSSTDGEINDDDEDDDDQYCDTVDFALETSLHGLKYICQPERHIVERIFWMIAFGIGLTMAGWLISDVWSNYLSSPLIVTFEPFETTIDKIPFPAITICNMNKVLKSKAEEFIRLAQGPEDEEETIEARKNVYYLDHVCSSSKSFSQKFNYSSKRGQVDPSLLARTRVEDGDDEQRDVARFLQIASQPCDTMLLLCAWQDTTYNCSDLFKPIETDFGKCCSFNMIPHLLLYKNMNEGKYDAKEIAGWAKWDIEKNGLLVDDEERSEHSHSATETPRHHYSKPMPFPRRQKRAGKSSGLSVLLNPDLEEYFCTSSDSHGFQLVKHLPIDNPKVVDFGIAIRPNAEVFMGVKPEITMADRDIYNFKLEKRNCYFYGEFPLAYYKLYTSTNCYDECLANQTYEICGCVSYYMPRDDTRDLCGALSFHCAENVRKSSLQSVIKSRCDFCLPACTELEYFSETTFTPLQDGDAIWIRDGTSTSTTAPWSSKNLSIVHIYFSSDSSYARVRKELYGLTDLIANTGGLMGLCLGFSGLSLVEVIYFYTLRAWFRSKAKIRLRSQSPSKSNKGRRLCSRRTPMRWPMAKKLGEMLATTKLSDDNYKKRQPHSPDPKQSQMVIMNMNNISKGREQHVEVNTSSSNKNSENNDRGEMCPGYEYLGDQPPFYADNTTRAACHYPAESKSKCHNDHHQNNNITGNGSLPVTMTSRMLEEYVGLNETCLGHCICSRCHFCCCMLVNTSNDGMRACCQHNFANS